MRKLTIYRKPTTQGRFSQMNVFVEDPSGEVVLNGHPCRKIGTLKSGDINIFDITEDAVKIILVPEQEGRNDCLEIHQFEAGTNNVSIIGNAVPEKNAQVPFDSKSEKSQINPEKPQKGRVIRRWIVRVLIFAICILLIRNYEPSPKTFTKGGFNITLTSAFEEKDDEESLAKYASKKAVLYVDKISAYNDDELKYLTTREFAERIIANSDSAASVTTSPDGLVMVEIEYESDSTTSFVYVFRTIDAFWTAEFLVRSKNADSYREQIDQWASSVEFYK